LTGVSDTGYAQNFQFDAFGNMYMPNGTGITPTSASQFTNNQLPSNTGIYNYDAAGNETLFNANAVTYDAENRQTAVSGVGVSETYVYDGDGRRVGKISAASGTPTTVFVYDALGRMAAEYSTLQDQPNCITCYMSADQLGTARLVTDQIGNVVSRHDYTPFGGEIASNSAGRNSSQWGPFSDSINQKFTGKERDSESGLDYFGARYYGSALGRFTSPDWSRDPEPVPYASLDDPQTLNLYSYVRNRPLSARDDDGHVQVCGDQYTTVDSTTGATTVHANCFEMPFFQFAMAVGHHYIPREVWQDLDRASKAYKFLSKVTTRALRRPRLSNSFDRLHRALNRQVDEVVRETERDLGKSLRSFERGDFEELTTRLEAAGEDVAAFNDRLAELEPEARTFAEAVSEALADVFPAAASAAEATAPLAEAAAEAAVEIPKP
jgi:RHS repeat-associated protein